MKKAKKQFPESLKELLSSKIHIAAQALLLGFCVLSVCSLPACAVRPAAESSAASVPAEMTQEHTEEVTDTTGQEAYGNTGDPQVYEKTEDPQVDDHAEDPEIYENTEDPETLRSAAAKIAETYQVSILYGEDVPRSFRDYTVSPLEDFSRVPDSLQVVEEVLSLYPPNFFPTVREGYCDEIVICLAGGLHASGAAFMESAHAFTTMENGRLWLVLNSEEKILSSTLVHELTHVTDYRLLGMHQLNEREWNRLNPPDFSYYNAYVDGQGTDYRLSGSTEYTSGGETDPERIYFFDPYSRTYAMEDRARLMETLLTGRDQPGTESGSAWDRCFSSPHVQTKLRFYFYTLRQAFSNSRWPEETAWEEALRKAMEKE